MLVTDAIAGLCLEEGSTFKSGQQVAEACIPKQIVSCLTRHKQMLSYEDDDKGEDNCNEGKRKDASKVKSGRAVVLGTETLMGSVATLLSSVQR